jgi:hypothetical protein
VHTPAVQPVAPCGLLQVSSHAPQLEVLARSASQPLVASSSQLANPSVQAGTHNPTRQLVVPCSLLQVRPQLPQLWLSLAVSASQPLLAVKSQSA